MAEDNFAMGYALGQDSNGGGNGGGGFWGSEGLWAVIILAIIFGWGNNGFGGNNGGMQSGVATRTDLCSEFSFQDVKNGVRGIADGLCSLGYDQLAQINGVNANIAAGFAGVNNAVCTLGYQNAQLINGVEREISTLGYQSQQGFSSLASQLASCCCSLERGIDGINYNIANQTRDIVENNNANTRAILDYLCQDKISTLQAENQSLRLAASQSAQNNYLISQLKPCPQPAYLTCNPFTGQSYVGTYGNNSCGCGC